MVPTFTMSDRLRKARECAGLGQQELADAMGVDRKTVGNYEGEKVEPRKIVLNAWALATGVDRQWLETGEVPDTGGPDGGNGITVRTFRPLDLVAA